MRKWKQAGMALVLALLLAAGADISAWGAVVAACSFGGSSDARLPICCRRHGRHHCPMMDGTGALNAQLQALMAADTRHPGIHAACDCQTDSPRAATSGTAWMPDESRLRMRIPREAGLCDRIRHDAQSLSHKLWCDRGPPPENRVQA